MTEFRATGPGRSAQGPLPVPAAGALPEAAPRAAARAAILVVDDQHGNLRVLEGLLGDLGHDIVSASSGSQALSSLLDRDFAVILLDVRMPAMDGFETAELIRKRRRSRLTPIIFVTAADDDVDQIVRGYALGAVDYIMKPLNGDILRSKVKVFVNLFLQSRELASKSAELTEKNAELEREIARRERAERVIAQSRDFYLSLFDDFPTLVWRSDEQGRIDYYNRSWLAFVGRTLKEMQEGGWTQDIHPDDRARCLERYQQAFRGREPFEVEYRQRRQDGEYRWILNHGRPYRNLEGAFAGFVGSCSDITPRRQSEEETRAANAELEAFSYTVSHDLRAPLRSMAGLCEILIETYSNGAPLDFGWKDYVHRISDAAAQLDRLIRDLLEFSRMGRSQLQPETVDLAGLMADVTRDLRFRGNLVIDAPLRSPVVGNRVFLSQVFSNLVSNAFKFVPEGVQPRVRIRTEARESGWIRIWVEDNGIGIAPEYQERIWNVFERLNDAARYPGTGIGLAIVRRAVGRMGGRVGVESAEGQGSRFWVELPEAHDTPAGRERRSETSPPSEGTSVRL
ncbi:MAG TPA: ATP-binding protein [Planctomycetota bacterium]|nr:ATP-binding protein [Planctomycetota bacterium]